MRLLLRAVLFTLMFTVMSFAVAQDAPLKVIASFSILADVVQNVGGSNVEVATLIPVGVDPHSYEPSAQDIAALQDADLIFVAGGGFEETLLETIESAASGTAVIEASSCVPVRPYAGETHADGEHAEDDHVHEDSNGGGHADALGLDLDALCAGYDTYLADLDTLKADMGFASAREPQIETLRPLYAADCGEHHDETAGEEEHDHGPCDPHVWSDPHNVYYWTLYIRDVLSSIDPANAESYHANAEGYLYGIDDLVRLIYEPLLTDIPAEQRVLVTNHETLGYFAAAYGFETAGVVLPGGSSLAEPSAQDIAALIETVRAAGASAIFVENTVSARVAEQIAAETGAQVYTLYTDSLSEPNGVAATYLDYIGYNFETIAGALSQ